MAKIHLIGNAHLDPIWLWRWQEGFSEILATYRSALDRMKEFPDFNFTTACAVYHEWIEKVDPEMFAEIQKRVKEGRWNIVGGWFLQPDCNIPSGESFARHGLISQRYFKDKLGVTAKIGYNVDSFGHNASLPQILKMSGMEGYVFMRPMPEEQGRDETVFLWESADGTRIPAYRIPHFYNIDTTRMEVFDWIREKADKLDMDLMAFYGVGNHGGGPTIELLHAMNQYEMGEKVYSSPDRYFSEVDKENLPVIADELQHHARGCYSVCTSIKKGNRLCENNLIATETLCSMANELVGTKYPAKKLKKAWKNVLMNQFHDIVGGCCVKKAYEDASYLHGEVMSITEQEMNHAMQTIAQKINTLHGEQLPYYKVGHPAHWMLWESEKIGTPIVVFNPHTWTVQMPIEAACIATKVTDDKDVEVPFQIVRGHYVDGPNNRMQTIFTAEVEPLGYRVYRIFTEQKSEMKFVNQLKATEHSLENEQIRVDFDKETGDICRIYDKKKQCLIMEGACRAILLDETEADTWAHAKTYLGELEGQFGEPKFSVIEEGDVRATLRVKTHYKGSTLQRDYIITPDSNVIKVNVKVDFQEKHRTLKFAFPAGAKNTMAKIPFGTISRENGLGEEPCGSWIATGTLGIANDCKYAYDTTEYEVRLTILRSAAYADHWGVRDEFCENMDMGVHECSYMLFPYESNAKAEQVAEELNMGLRAIVTSFHEGTLPERYSCYSCEAKHIVVTSVKQSEDGLEKVIRFYEADGIGEDVEMKVFSKNLKASAAHHEIKTIRTDGEELNLIEW